MAKSNRRRIDEALETIVKGFKPFVADRLTSRYGDDWVSQAAKNSGRKYDRSGAKVNEDDPDFLLHVVTSHWHNIFGKVLGNAERSYVGELAEARNRWAHQENFTLDDVVRIVDTGYRLLSSVGAAEASDLDEMRQEAQRLRFEDRTKKETRAPLPGMDGAGVVDGLRPWRDVVAPHSDVASGRYQQAEFAADLAQVHHQRAVSEYGDPTEFFKRTHITRGLHDLLVQTMRRVTGVGGAPIVDLLTNFGGGKTHSLLAVYHMCDPRTDALALPNVDKVAIEEGVEEFPSEINRAVLVGTALSPNRISEKDDGTSVQTIWGEMAWQLGGAEAYEMVQPEDEGRVDPGSEVLQALLSRYAPCVILIDEWVAYARQLWDREDLLAGTFDAQMSFAQSLTEGVKAVPTAMLLVSIPASDNLEDELDGGDAVEVGGPGGVETLKRLRHVIKRTEAPWQPADAEESFEIVRRRLFGELDAEGYAQRDATARRFHQLYTDNKAEFPSEARQPDYEERIKRAYPIHPELFDRLYQDWASLERFQRTRGVLRLMASVVHTLWDEGDQRPLIMPGSIPLDDRVVREEFTNHLEANWASVIDADIDGDNSTSTSLDREVQALGRIHATRRVARTIFLGSAPRERRGQSTDRVQAGVEDIRIKLGTVMPGESPATFGDALRRMSDKASYLFQVQSRYWFGTEPSIQRKAQDQAEAYPIETVHSRIVEEVRRNPGTGGFARVHPVPSTSAEVPDDPETGLVILGPAHCHKRKRGQSSESSSAQRASQEITEKRGTLDRQYRNAILFLAPDEQHLPHLEDAVRQEMAWEAILDQKDELDLSQGSVRQANQKLEHFKEMVQQQVHEAYRWLIYPTAKPQQEVEYAALKINGSGTLTERAGKKARAEQQLLDQLGPTTLRTMLDEVPLWKGDHVEIADLWRYFATLPYLPRLASRDVLLDAVGAGPAAIDIARDGFGYAESVSDSGEYRGLVVHQLVINPSPDAVIVKPGIATALADKAQPSEEDETAPGDDAEEGGAEESARPSRLLARKRVDSVRAVKEMSSIHAEVIQELLGQEANPEIAVSLDVAVDQIDRDVLTVLIENLRALGFHIDFEY